jgi:lactate permease
MSWIQAYDPLGAPWLSTAAAALPIVLLLVALGVLEWRAHMAALAGLLAALAVSVFVFGMPLPNAGATALYGAAYGFLPIGWIILNAVFLYNLTVETGQFEIVKSSVGRLSRDRRIQALLVAFSFGAFIEGASGFGTPVAICSALLIGLGFTPLYAAGLSLIANTAPVAFGAIGTPILTLAAVTGIPAHTLGVMAGRQLPFVSLLVPAWLVVTMSGWRGLRGVWPAVVVCGGTFAAVQFAWSNYIGPELVDIAGGLASIAALALFARVWQPAAVWEFPGVRPGSDRGQTGVRPGSDQGQTGVRPGSDRGQTRVRPGSDRGQTRKQSPSAMTPGRPSSARGRPGCFSASR